MLNNFCFHVYAQKSLSHSHTLSLSLFHSLIHLFTCWTTFVYAQKSLSHSLNISHSHTLSLSYTLSLSLDMLNNFCFYVYVQKSLFIAEQSFYESKATYISSVITEARGNFRHMYSDNVDCIYCNNCDFQSQSHLNSNMIKLFWTVLI